MLPPHYADQESLTAALSSFWAEQHFNADRLAQIHRAALVAGRYLALPLAEYPALDTFGKRNDAYIRVALEVGERAVRRYLAGSLEPPPPVSMLRIAVGAARSSLAYARVRRRRSG